MGISLENLYVDIGAQRVESSQLQELLVKNVAQVIL